MEDKSSYPLTVTPNAPPPGLNPYVGHPEVGYPGPPGGPMGYPPSSGPGYPPTGGYPPASGYAPPSGYPPGGDGYPPAGYPPASGYPPGGDGYPPPGYLPAGDGYPPPGYPQPGGYIPPESYNPQGGYPPPMVNQPTAGVGYPHPGNQPGSDANWMPMPTGVSVCPPGLEYLAMIDQLIIHQKVELLEAFLSFETKNKYSIKNSMGQKVYTAKEDTDCCTRNCLGTLRPFDMKIKDNAGNEVIHLYRAFRCNSCLCPCCLQRMEVMSPPGTLIGAVVQEWSVLSPKFRVENAAGDTVLRIEGPICTFSICGDVEFKVLSRDGDVQVGKITKQWAGLLREAFTDADYFGITFPLDLEVNIKAVLLGACMLIDFMFFEKQGNKEEDMPGML